MDFKEVIGIEIEFLKKELALLQTAKMINDDEKEYFLRIAESMGERLDLMEEMLGRL